MHSMQNLEYQQCRTCYDSKSNLILLTSLADTCASQAAVDKSYAQLLLEVCNINIMDDKPLGRWPHFICLNCSHKLKIAYDFIQKTQQIDQLLQSIAKELENKGEPNFIEKPALDIPLEIKTEKEDVEIDSNDREFQYSPDPVDVVKAELNSTTGGKHEQSIYNNNGLKKYKNNKIIENDNESVNEIFVSSTIEFSNEDIIFKGILDKFHSKITSNMDHKIPNNNPTLTGSHNDQYSVQKSRKTNVAATNDTEFACSKCAKTYPCKWMLNRHERYSHITEDKKVSCNICGQKFSRPSNFKRHMKGVHMKKRDKKSKSKLKKTKTKNVSTEVTCNVCRKTFLDPYRLMRHKRYVHLSEEDKIPCTFCDQKFSRTDHVQEHIKRKHTPNVSTSKNSRITTVGSKYCCDKCDRSYTRRASLVRHEIQAHA